MATKKLGLVQGKRFRVTGLDECGRVVSTSMYAVDNGFVSLSISAEVEDGSEITLKNFTGGFCINERANDTLKYFTIEAEFCGVNPDVLTIMTNAKAYQDYNGDTAGVTVAEGEIATYYALEVWTGLSGAACGANEDELASGYFLLPFAVGGVLTDIEWGDEDAVTFSLANSRTRGGNAWGVGPYNVVFDNTQAAKLPEALDPLDHLLILETGVKPPEITDAPVKALAV